MLQKRVFVIFLFLTCLSGLLFARVSNNDEAFRVKMPATVVQHIPVEIEIVFPQFTDKRIDTVSVFINGSDVKIPLKQGVYRFTKTFDKKEALEITYSEGVYSKEITPIPLWMSILPPLIAILMALVFREVFVALFVGIWIGSIIITFYQGYTFFAALFYGLFAIIDVYIIESLNDTGHLSIIVFSMMIGAMVTLITDNGGMRGVVNILARYAKSPRSGQLVTWFLGMAIFFDDYANTLVVGNTMRPVTDRLKISREKLSYIVDSTAAPIASIAFVTTWIGAELSYIQDGIVTLNLDETAYDVFLNSLQYSFYPILALSFILILVASKRDYGPMLKAENYMRTKGVANHHPKVKTAEAVVDKQTERWYNAVIPVVVIVIGTIAGLISTGLENTSWDPGTGFLKNVSNIIGHSDSYRALLWSSLAGVVVAVVLTVGQRIMGIKESVESLISGFKTMITAVLILVLAWSIALITKYMHTADFISTILLEVNIAPFLIPSITFILAALVAFATGSSWGTMAILYPLILPSSWLISQESGLDYDQTTAIFHNVVSTVLAGSVLGDHCSPISDTTILSSLASSCNHIEHVRTQLPYALTVGFVGIFFGTLPAAYGVPTYILFPVGIVILFLIVRFFGRKSIQMNS